MSSWLREQQEHAFSLYRRYIAMSLHFQAGSSYDYAMYSGNTKVTIETFISKPATLINKFRVLFDRLLEIDHEDFLFANIRSGNTTIDGLLDAKAMQIYRSWKDKYGNGNCYKDTVKAVLSSYIADHKNPTVTQLFIELLDNHNDEFAEAIIWGIQNNSGLDKVLREYAKDNIFHEINFNKIENIMKIYLYFNIL